MKTPFTPNTAGIFFGLPEEDYRKAPGENISALKHMGQSPAHYQAYITRPKEEPTPAQQFGTLLHACLLEPSKADFVEKPDDVDYRTKAGKEWRDSQVLPILNKEEADNIRGAQAALRKHPTVQAIIGSAPDHAKEVAVFRHHEETGLLLKGRIDILTTDREENTVVVDIKTTDDASPGEFSRAIAKWGYDQQAAHYLDLTLASFFVFIVVEKNAPYGIGVYTLDEESIDIGREKNRKAYRQLVECRATNTWPAYEPSIQTISLPRWAKMQKEAA